MAGQPELSFAGLIRQLRAEAGLTQEELAQAAGLPVRTLSDLERGISRTAHKDTAVLLASALGLAGPVRELFVASARGRADAVEVLARQQMAGGGFTAVTQALPRDLAVFTGRQAELARLLRVLAAAAAGGGVVGIHAVDGMAGVGKTTFAVHAAHQLTGTFPDGQFFLPLHAHTPGQRPVDPADALGSLLLATGVPAALLPPGVEARSARWRDAVAGKKILLVLDDAASHEQVRPLLPGTPDSLVLVTSRRRLTALEDTTVISLDVLSPGEATALLARLAARPGLRPADTPVGEIARLCGYLPLAIGMIASQLRHHPARTADQAATELGTARDRLALMHAENLSVTAAFGLSYQDLTHDQQRLFRRLGLVPGPSFDAYAAAALDGTSLDAARRHLDELYDQHLLTEPAPGRYRMHDLIRAHARTLAANNEPAESHAATGRLLDYYLHTALAAGQYFATWARAYRRPPLGYPPAHIPDLSTPRQAGSWLEAERTNLHAAVEYATDHGRFLHAVQIPAALSGFLSARGFWDQSITLHQIALAAARASGDRVGEAIALSKLGSLAYLAGDYPAATASLRSAAAIYGDLSHLPDQAHALSLIGVVQKLTGDFSEAIATYQLALALAQRADDRPAEAAVLNCLGEVQHLTGDFLAAIASQELALKLHIHTGNRYGQGMAFNDLGVIHQETGDYPRSAASQHKALEIFRDVGDRLSQAIALNDLGVLQRETGDHRAARESHRQALTMFHDFGHRLGQAEALNRLGELAAQTSATYQAREHHTQALTIAQDIGVPYEQARALAGLGRAHLHDGNASDAAAHLRQALSIYQRIGAHAAQRVQQTLQQHGLTASTAEPGTTPPSEDHPRKPHTAPSPSPSPNR